MKPSTTPILLFTCLAAVAVQATDIANVKCGVLDYYGSLSSMSTSQWTKQQVRDLIVSTHNKTLPSLGQRGEANIMDALVDLDPGTKNGTTVHVYMSDNNTASDSDAKLQNIPEGWKRGDLWPLARGAGLDTPAGTDVHAKRPIGWEVDSALFSLFWGECGTVEMNSSCVVPAVANQTANTTAQDGKIKTPPESMRGEVARSVFYNALRYGEELGITLTDCPPFNATEYGYLSTLLSWHAQYPVTAAELARNDRACSHWQGNRNPFVDQPQLVEQFFGKPDTVLNGTFMYSQCTVPTMSPTASPNECSSLSPGDVNVVIFNSDPVDQMVFFPVSDIHESVGGIFVTDKAWNGTDFVTDEGTLEV